MADPPPLTTVRVLWRTVRCRCPLCGGGGCFESFFRMRPRCPRCNLSLDRIEGHWVGSLGINTIVSFGALLLTLAVGIAVMWPEPRVIPLLIPALIVAIVLPALFFPLSRTLWSGIDLLMRPLEPEDDVDPVWIPPARNRPH